MTEDNNQSGGNTGLWVVTGVLIIIPSVILSVLIAGWLHPLVGVVAFLISTSLGFMSAANTVFEFVENVESYFSKNEQVTSDSSESTKIGGGNVSNREEIINQQLKRLDGWYRVIEGESWKITPQDSIADDPKFLLYVLAAKVASENSARDSSEVSLDELNKEVDTKLPSSQFAKKSQHFLTLNYDPDEDWLGHDIEENEAKVEFDFDAIEEGVDWILSGSRNPPREYDSG